MKITALNLACALLGVTAMIATANAADTPRTPFAIAVHGGSGTIEKGEFSPEKENEIRAALERAVRSGHEILAAGGSSLDAVTRAVTELEDSPHFNAGRGAVFNAEGKNELDASIMEGNALNAGAVAAVHNVRNPILLARRVMTDSAHVMLMGEGAESFARQQGIAFEDDSYFYTDYRWQQLQKAKASDRPDATFLSETPDQWFSTVGAVALDQDGNLAAATSTGGMTNKQWGRVGDSPIIGAGTYADNRSCAVSATGHGEYFIRATVARDVCARVQYTGASLAEASRQVVREQLTAMGGDGGIIAVDPHGNVSLTFNTSGMYRASIDAAGELYVAIFGDE
jgi:beta-aspartyl-peptidase (threonine type)